MAGAVPENSKGVPLMVWTLVVGAVLVLVLLRVGFRNALGG